MDHSLVMTVVGPDRPWLRAKLAKTIDEHGGSWFESKMARFAGQFAGILRFDCPDEKHDEMLDALNALGVSTREMMSIFQAMKRAGALQAELVIN